MVKEGKWRVHGQEGALSFLRLESYLRLYPNTRFSTYLTNTQIRDAVKLLLLNTLGSLDLLEYNILTKQFVFGDGDKTLCLPEESLHDMTPSLFVEGIEKARIEKGWKGMEYYHWLERQPLTKLNSQEKHRLREQQKKIQEQTHRVLRLEKQSNDSRKKREQEGRETSQSVLRSLAKVRDLSS